MEYLTIKKLAHETGYSEKAIRGKIDQGVFREGVHYIKSPDGRIQIVLEKYLEWVRGVAV